MLKLSPASAEAQQILQEARQTQQRLDSAAAEARAAFGRGNMDAASEALGRVMALDPRHPAVGELSGELNRSFRRQAEDSRRADGSRADRRGAGARIIPGQLRGGPTAARRRRDVVPARRVHERRAEVPAGPPRVRAGPARLRRGPRRRRPPATVRAAGGGCRDAGHGHRLRLRPHGSVAARADGGASQQPGPVADDHRHVHAAPDRGSGRVALRDAGAGRDDVGRRLGVRPSGA